MSSIHPRVIEGHTIHPKVNTAKPRSAAKLQRAAEGMEKHLEEHPSDAACMQRLTNLKERMTR